MKEKSKKIPIFIILFYFLIEFSYISSTTLEEFLTATKELAFSYYMRGKYIQYSTSKKRYFSPEEATRQKISYSVCTTFIETIYEELLNIKVPMKPQVPSENEKENPLVAHSYIREDNIMEMRIYDEEGKYRIIENPSIDDLIPHLQIGDVLAHPAHYILIYDVERNQDGKVIDALIIESGFGGKSYISTKVPRNVSFQHPDCQNFVVDIETLFLNEHLNTDFKEGGIEGSIGIRRLSKYSSWANLNITGRRYNEYNVLRFIKSDSKGNAAL